MTKIMGTKPPEENACIAVETGAFEVVPASCGLQS